MPGDTYTPPRHADSTVLESGNVLEFHMKSREDLKSPSTVQAERAVTSAYQQQDIEVREQLSGVEIAALQLAELHKARLDKMAA